MKLKGKIIAFNKAKPLTVLLSVQMIPESPSDLKGYDLLGVGDELELGNVKFIEQESEPCQG